MSLRRAVPVVFVALCLGLSALVLRRQIATHPIPRDTGVRANADQAMDLKTWRGAAAPERRAVLKTVLDQLAAIRAGDADRAWFYQSRGLHRNFRSARAFESEIVNGYPEFGHAKSAKFGPVGVDPTGNHAAVAVTVQGENGRWARANYLLVREDGGYRVEGVAGGR